MQVRRPKGVLSERGAFVSSAADCSMIKRQFLQTDPNKTTPEYTIVHYVIPHPDLRSTDWNRWLPKRTTNTPESSRIATRIAP